MVDERVPVVFKGLTPEESDLIVQRGEITRVKQGEPIFKAGEPARFLFSVLSGKIELRIKVVYYLATVEIPLEAVAAGGTFGWSALVPPCNYTLSAHATEDSELLKIGQTDLQELCEANSRVGNIVLTNITRVVGARYELVLKMLVGEIQNGLKAKDPFA
jgi:CRP-like cAMP-binding protein